MLYCIKEDVNGNPVEAWTYPTTGCIGPIVSSPAIGADGRLYFGTQIGLDGWGSVYDPRIVCLDPASASPTTEIWVHNTSEDPIHPGGGAIDGSLAIGPDGIVWAPVDVPFTTGFPASRLLGLDPQSGIERFEGNPESANNFDSSPILASDGSVFIKETVSVATNPETGEAATLLNFQFAGQDPSGGVIFGDMAHKNSVGSETFNYHMDYDDTHRDTTQFPNGGISSPFSSATIGSDGKLYTVVSFTHQLTCLAAPSGYSFWPGYRANQFGTGSAQDNKWTTNTLAGTTASITTLSSPGVGNSLAYQVNSKARSVGSGTASSGLITGAWWTTTSPYGTLLPISSASYDYVGNGINNNNQAVGNWSTNGQGPQFAVYWASLTTTAAEIPRPDSTYTQSHANSINVDGYIAGDALNSSSKYHAMRWHDKDQNGSYIAAIDLGTLGSSSLQSYGYGVSPRDWSVGKSQSVAGGVYHAFATPPNRVITGTSDNLNPNDQGEAHAMNGTGQIVGSSKNGTTAEHAWIWYINTDGTISTKDLGTLGGTTSRALGINNRGHVVGWSYRSDGSVAAFIWVPGWSVMQELRNFLSSTDKTSWPNVSIAYGVSDDGTVVGYGSNGGYSRGFAVKPKP